MDVPEESGRPGGEDRPSDGPAAAHPYLSLADHVTLIGERPPVTAEPAAPDVKPPAAIREVPLALAAEWRRLADGIEQYRARLEVEARARRAILPAITAEASAAETRTGSDPVGAAADPPGPASAPDVESAEAVAVPVVALPQSWDLPDTVEAAGDESPVEAAAPEPAIDVPPAVEPAPGEPLPADQGAALARVASDLAEMVPAPPVPAEPDAQVLDAGSERVEAPDLLAEPVPSASPPAAEMELPSRPSETTPTFIPPPPAAEPRAFIPVATPTVASRAPEVPAATHQPDGFIERYSPLAKRVVRYAAYAVGGYAALVVFLIFAYRFVNPPASTLMLYQSLTGVDVEQTWVPLEEISPSLVRAVVVSEDNRFCEHWGIDLREISDALERGGRGASTISMQVSKNLFLWSSKSYIRKAAEVPVTLMIEAFWPKRRIMEVYLNIAEWGPGRFGAEEAARWHFSKSAQTLTEREAARLAVALPNPFTRDAGDPGPGTLRLASTIQARMRYAPRSVTACLTTRTPPRPTEAAAPAPRPAATQKSADPWQPVVKPQRQPQRQPQRPPQKAREEDRYQGPVIDGWR